MSFPLYPVVAVFVGGPKTLRDERGEWRPNPGLTVYALNHCYYHDYRPELAERFFAAEGLMEWWKQRLREKAHQPV